MYLFEAYYENVNTYKEIVRDIEFREDIFSNEKQSYVYAMQRAYDMKQADECLISVEFVSC